MTDTTLFIPTFNRPHHLRRLLWLYESLNFCGEVLILDSSEDDLSLETSGFDLNIRHQFYDSQLDIVAKYAKGLALVKTPFVQFCADDDFVDPIGISACGNFLESNLDFAAAQGDCVHFSAEIDEGNLVSLARIRGESSEDLDSDDLTNRLMVHTVRYRPTHYALQRTQNLLSVCEDLASRKECEIVAIEALLSFSCVAAGKVKRLPISFEYRESHSERLSGRISNWDDLVTRPDWPQQYNILENHLANLLIASSGDEVENRRHARIICKEWLKLSFDKYFVRDPCVWEAIRACPAPGKPRSYPPIPWRQRAKTAFAFMRHGFQKGSPFSEFKSSESTEFEFPPMLTKAIELNARSLYQIAD